MAVTTGGRVITTTTPDGEQIYGFRAAWTLIRRSWPATRMVLVQVGLAVALSVGIAMWRHDERPFFAALFAVATTELICARHHRRLVEMFFGLAVGLLLGALDNPVWPSARALSDALIGAGIAIGVAVATTPRDPARLVRAETGPLLAQLSIEIRSVARALRTRDAAAAADAVKALRQTDAGLRALDETLFQVRRSAPLAKFRHGVDLPELTTSASEISEAVRSIRRMARHAWWDVLRAKQPIPAALPQMVETPADGTALLRAESAEGDQPVRARMLLASAAQWADVIRDDRISLSAAAVAAETVAAVHSLLVASGLSAELADAKIQRPT